MVVLVPERAQSCRAVAAAVVMAMRVMKDADHEVTRLPQGQGCAQVSALGFLTHECRWVTLHLMKSTVKRALVLLGALTLGACRQADGPIPQADANTEEELNDVKRDLQNIAQRDPNGPRDLEHDVTKYARKPEEIPSISELSRRTATVIVGRMVNDQAAGRLAHSLWTTIWARQISERQVETLQNDVQSILVSIGVVEEQARQVAAQVGEVQKVVSARPRRWYEFF